VVILSPVEASETHSIQNLLTTFFGHDRTAPSRRETARILGISLAVLKLKKDLNPIVNSQNDLPCRLFIVVAM